MRAGEALWEGVGHSLDIVSEGRRGRAQAKIEAEPMLGLGLLLILRLLELLAAHPVARNASF